MRKHKENQLMGKITKTKELRTTSHVEESLEKLLGGIINSILEAEMDEHLGNEKYKHVFEKKENYRNGIFKKIVKVSFGDIEIKIPRDRSTKFNPVIVPKYTIYIFELEKHIMELCNGNNTKEDIKAFVEYIYSSDVSESLLNNIINRILPDIERWKVSLLLK